MTKHTIKILPCSTSQNFQSMFGHFSTLFMKGLTSLKLKRFVSNFSSFHFCNALKTFGTFHIFFQALYHVKKLANCFSSNRNDNEILGMKWLGIISNFFFQNQANLGQLISTPEIITKSYNKFAYY